MHDEPTPPDGPVVYFIQAERGGPVKIGFSSSRSGVAARLMSLQTGNPERLVVRGTVDDVEWTEREYHERFAQYRLVGEWFLNVDEVVAATGAAAATPREDGHMLQPLLSQAFEAGRQRGKLEGELETRHMLRAFFGKAMEWLFCDEQILDRDLDLSCAARALDHISNSSEMARYRRQAQKHLARHERPAASISLISEGGAL